MKTNHRGQVVRDNLTGTKTTGCLIVEEFDQKTPNGGSKWWCKCTITGERLSVWAECIKRGSTKWCKSCRKKVISKQRTTHGMKDSPEYNMYYGMIGRCYDPDHQSYNLYGGRGITVCARWLECFENWYANMGPRPSLKHSIERIDNNGNYCPENCKWATMTDQANNRRTNKTLTFNGKTQTYSQWAKELGIDKTTIRKRVLLGWPVEKVLHVGKFHKSQNPS